MPRFTLVFPHLVSPRVSADYPAVVRLGLPVYFFEFSDLAACIELADHCQARLARSVRSSVRRRPSDYQVATLAQYIRRERCEGLAAVKQGHQITEDAIQAAAAKAGMRW